MTCISLQPWRASAHDNALGSTAFSHIGLVRTTNEDRVLNDADRSIFAVADGMGGHSLGDWAATMVVQALIDVKLDGQAETAIRAALDDANARIFCHAQQRRVTCGSTVAGLVIGEGGCALMFWAGDSRIYRMRQGILQRLSRDHSVVQELLDAGVLDETQARNHPRGNVITRAIGVAPSSDLEMLAIEWARDDLYLVCSDGVSGALGDDEISALLHQRPIAAAASDLRAAALRAGGKDNLSAILVEA